MISSEEQCKKSNKDHKKFCPSVSRIKNLLFPDVNTENYSNDCNKPTEQCISEEEQTAVLDNTINFINLLLDRLQEKNIPLFERIVCYCGVEMCKEVLLEATSALQQNNNRITTTDGFRYRSMGGTFIYFLKKRLSKAQINVIWSEQKKEQSAFKRQLKNTSSCLDKIVAARVQCVQKYKKRSRHGSTSCSERLNSESLEIEEGEVYDEKKEAKSICRR